MEVSGAHRNVAPRHPFRRRSPCHPPQARQFLILEVNDRAVCQRFSVEFKSRILQEADACEPGQIGALLRREALYSSHLTTWRHQREQMGLAGLQPRKRGRKANPRNPLRAENEKLLRENSDWRNACARRRSSSTSPKNSATYWGWRFPRSSRTRTTNDRVS